MPAAVRLLPDVSWELPYEGAKEMLLVEQLEDPAFLKELITAMEPELPEPKKKKRK